MRRSTLARWRRTHEEDTEGAGAVYRKIIIATGIGSAVTAAGYAVAAGMATSPDIELSSRVGSVCLTIILGLGVVSYSTWLVNHANRTCAREHADITAEAVAERIAMMLGLTLADVAGRQHARTVAAFREIVTSELITEQLDAAAKRIHRYGMITEASGRVANSNIATIRRN